MADRTTFDISHVQGADTVASMVVCENGQMKKGDYRRFKVESVKGPDDFASMRKWFTAGTKVCSRRMKESCRI